MCGIAGKVTGGKPVERGLIERMCAALVHRGPDSGGVHVRGPAAIGMRRLAVIDVEGGAQPIYSEDGSIVLVLNGEIYNHRALRRELAGRGHALRSGSDAEVVVHLYEELGAACVDRLQGMFAFAVWDERRGRLMLARDRLGKKPLYWALHGGALVFGSEPRALLQDPELPREPDPVAIDAFLVNQYVPHHLCAFRGMRKLAPASTVVWSPGGTPHVARYWDLEYRPKLRLGADEAAERLRGLILAATGRRLESEVPLGALLSGGLDSSTVVAAAVRASGRRIKTFSVAFRDQGVDESAHARAVARHCGTEHHELELDAIEPGLLPRIAWHLGEPLADPAVVPTFQLAELTRRHVTVALNGDGGDESFAGYDRYRRLASTRPAEALPAHARRALASRLLRLAGGDEGRAPWPRAARLARRAALSPPRRYADLFRHFGEADRGGLYGPALSHALDQYDPLSHVEAEWLARPGVGWADRAMATDLRTYLPDDLLAKVDLTSMAHGLEVRSPLLDQELMAFAARLPARLKGNLTSGKLLLKRAVRPWLPAEIIDRPKHGFAVPIAAWLRGPLREFAEDMLLDRATVARGMLAPAGVRAALRDHAAGHDRSLAIWTMLSLELWLRTCVDAMPATALAA
jgi:asparagine synthase (glutamine-hydrolysing)